MKSLITTLLITLSFAALSQRHLDDIYTKRSLKQEGEQYQFTILDEDKHGVLFYSKKKFYFWYKAQKVVSTQGASSGILLHGVFESFHDNKQLAQKGKFNRGLKVGEWMYWRMDGTLYISENWSRGKLHGLKKLYDEAGNVKEVIRIKGRSSRRVVSDSTIYTRSNGKYETIELKDSDGEIIRIEEKKKGKLNGKVKSYEGGKLVEVSKYKNGELISTKEVGKSKESTDEEKVPFWKKIFPKKGEGDESEPKKKEKSEKPLKEKKSTDEKSSEKKDKTDKKQ